MPETGSGAEAAEPSAPRQGWNNRRDAGGACKAEWNFGSGDEMAECCKHKATPRSEAFQKDIQTRLNRAIGQLNGVKAMIDDNRYCGDVLTQLAAAEKAIGRVSELILRDHLETCVTDRIKAGDTDAVDEVMTLIRQFS